uniref:Uncharacterized protein n=1 Tax=Hyaloperonospora arabidopsidis (strain Emoy2) TaxID=559515 RepID=M4BFU4_HYAAE
MAAVAVTEAVVGTMTAVATVVVATVLNVRTDFRVRVTDLPRDVDWRNVKDFLRTGGEVTYCNVEADGSARKKTWTTLSRSSTTRSSVAATCVLPLRETQRVARALVLLHVAAHLAIARVRARRLRQRTHRAAPAPDRHRVLLPIRLPTRTWLEQIRLDEG